MSIVEYVEIGLILLALVLLGYGFGRYGFKKQQTDGSVIIEPTEDGERDRIRFVLEMELDEITTRDQLLLKVENRLSKN